MENPSIEELVEEVKNYAYKNYNKGGWDFIVETLEDSEIKEMLTATGSWEFEKTPVTTVKQAIKRIGEVASLWDETR